MKNKSKENISYSIWSGCILIALVLVVFALVFSSVSGGGNHSSGGNGGSAAATTHDDEEESTVSASPAEKEEQPDAIETTKPDAGQDKDTETEQKKEDTEDGAVTDKETSEKTGNAEPEPTEEPEPVMPTSTILAETEDMGQEYIDQFIFLGDSTTYGLAAYNVVDKNQVWTPSSGTLTLDHWSYTTIYYPDTGEEIFITDALTRKQPAYIMITLGINGVSFMTEDYFIETYTALVEAVQEASPDTRIILNSIYPIAASYPNQDSINNNKIDAANGWVLRVAESTGVRYLDSESVLKGPDGYLPESSQNGDGLHLTGEAYGTVLQYLRTHGYQ